MRKNGINRELRPVEGGVCAPEGYVANAVSCGIREDGELDFGMIFSKRRCAVACAYANGSTVGAPVKVSKKNMRNGYIRAILVNGGVANAIDEKGEELAYGVCDLLFPWTIERTEIVIASTGYIGKRLTIEPFKAGIRPLYEGLATSNEQSLKVARAMRTANEREKQLAFAFDLGDYPCKIGVVFKGGVHTAPNMSTFLAFLTTDVNISTPMLQKALTAEVKETLNLLNIDGISSPNDTICIMANGRAGNYKISEEDSEYKKFTYALRAVLREICKETAKEGAQKVLYCQVQGALSKEASRSVSKAIVGSTAFKHSVLEGKMDVEGIVYTALANAYTVKTERISLSVRSANGEVVLYEDERTTPVSSEILGKILRADEVELLLNFNVGNFRSTATGRI